MEAVKETKFGTKVAYAMDMMPELYFGECSAFLHTEKAHDTTLDDENNWNVINRVFNNTHQGAPRTGKQTSAIAYALDIGDGSHVTCEIHAFDRLHNYVT